MDTDTTFATGNQPLTAVSLEDWLELNVSFVEREAPKEPPHGDLDPMLVAHKDDGPVQIIMPRWQNNDEKDVMMRAFRQYLKKTQADRYATVNAAWMIDFDLTGDDAEAAKEKARIVDEQGTGVFPELRVEVYVVSVGDTKRSLLQTLTVQRNEAGKIVGLVRKRVIDTSIANVGGPDMMHGRMVDLLRVPQ